MRSIESEGDTIDQAIEKALSALDLARDQVQIEILTDATRGLLGFGGKKARVRATVRPPLAARLRGGEEEDASGMDSRETPPSPSAQLAPAQAPARPTRPQAERPPGAPPAQALELKGKSTLEAILSRVGVSCAVEVRPGPDPGSVVLEVSGDSSG